MKKTHPKCRTCGKEHALGGCPEFKRSSPGDNTTLPHRKVGIADGGIRVGQSDTEAASLVERKEPSEKPGLATQQVEALPPHKPKMGRPRTGYIKAEYNRAYSADQRTIKRLGLNCTVKEWREKKWKIKDTG